MNGWQTLTGAWHWEPSITSGCALLVGLYVGLARPLTGRAYLFLAGVGVLLLSLVSPLDLLADRYLFSAHMLQHLLLVQVVPPLLMLGTPPWLTRRLLTTGPAQPLRWLLARPALTWLAFTGTLWLWHLPAFYDAALQHEALHIAEHLAYLVTAALFWWPVLAPLTGAVEPAPGQSWLMLLYLAAAVVAGTLLGIILAFAPPGLYPTYQQANDPLGILPLVREGWGLTPTADQQLGGLLMWIPGGLLYSFAFFATLARWFAEPEESAPPRSGRAPLST